MNETQDDLPSPGDESAAEDPRLVEAVREYHQRTGFLPRLVEDEHGMRVQAPIDVFMEWMTAFGVPDDQRANFAS